MGVKGAGEPDARRGSIAVRRRGGNEAHPLPAGPPGEFQAERADLSPACS